VEVAAGASKSLTFSSRLASVPEGVVSVTDAADAVFAATSCG
jgi:hypothetical protein